MNARDAETLPIEHDPDVAPRSSKLADQLREKLSDQPTATLDLLADLQAKANRACAPREDFANAVDKLIALSGGTKHDDGKPPLDLLADMQDALNEVAYVLQFGVKKYARGNWAKGISFTRVGAATLRHTLSWLRGEDLDPETGRHHMAHAACEALFAVAFALRKRRELDDRTCARDSDG